eukprot:COSAG01_NODE_5140_length_4459_cov_2.660092_1_plen_388_part_00
MHAKYMLMSASYERAGTISFRCVADSLQPTNHDRNKLGATTAVAPGLKSDDDDYGPTLIDNRRPRTLRGSGSILNGHDGSVQFWNGSYIYHALAYDNCTEQAEGCSSHCATCCGYTMNHRVSVYVSPTLAQDSWIMVAQDVVPLPIGPAPMGRGVIFRPKAVHSLSGTWHLFWANNLATASSHSPFGPFTFHGHVNISAGQAGDFDILIAPDGIGYAAYTHYGCVRVEQLNDDMRTSTGRFVSGDKLGPFNAQSESPAMFVRHGVYYLLYGRFCCFCLEGSGVFVHSAPHPLGPWTFEGNIGCTNGTEAHHSPLTKGCWALDHQRSITHSQLSAIIQTEDGNFIYAGDRWQQAPDKIKAHDPQVWLPLQFAGDRILPLRMVNTFIVH